MEGWDTGLRRSTSSGPCAAGVSPHGSGGAHSSRNRCNGRSIDQCLLFPKYFYKRRAAKRKVAERASWRLQQFLPPATPATTQEALPKQASSGRCRWIQGLRDIPAAVPRTVRRIPEPERDRSHVMAPRLCSGCFDSRRCAPSPGTPSPDHCSVGTIWHRRGLHPGVPRGSCGGTSDPAFSGQNNQHACTREAICTSRCSFSCCGSHLIPERTRDPQHPQEGDTCPEQHIKDHPACRSPFTTATLSVPKEAEGRCGQSTMTPACGSPSHLGLDYGGGEKEFKKGTVQDDRSQVNKPHSQPEKSTAVDFETMLSHPKWCAMLPALVLRTRSSFAYHLQKTFCLPRSTTTSAPTLFPIPLPYLGCFGRMTPDMSVRERKALSLRRVAYMVVYALNFWHYNGPPPDMDQLGRAPTSAHCRIHRRVESFIRSDQGMPSFMIAKAGRRFPQLIARISELSESVTRRGLGGDQYSRTFPGCQNEELEDIPELHPYRDLQAERLGLFGRGHWDITDFLTDELVMAYREPRSILIDRVPEEWEYPRCNDPPSELRSLARLWDGLGLLHVHSDTTIFERPFERVRIFNAFKSAEVDRQIGDRRGRNSIERKVLGPSSMLPTGSLLTDLVVCPRSQALRISISDRRDFYHQIGCSASRAKTNTIGSLPVTDLQDLKGYEVFLEVPSLQKYNRIRDGDRLGKKGFPSTGSVAKGSPSLQIAFNAILQGDHGGVEFATEAHTQLLKRRGVLQEDETIRSDRACRSQRCMQGLVIDDYFAISVEDSKTAPQESRSFALHGLAQEAYRDEDIMGSPAKDVLAEEKAKVIGALIDSSKGTRKKGLVKVGAPPEKRYGLSRVSLNIAQLQCTSDSLHLALLGGWVAAMTYRRPMLGILNHAFALVKNENYEPSKPQVLKLSRKVCDELVLLSVLAPLMCSNVGAMVSADVYATDASLEMGAIVKAPISRDVMIALFRSGRNKGGYTKLQSAAERLEEEESLYVSCPSRPLAFRFSFIEVFAGAALVTSAMAARGHSVCPPIELTDSEEYNMEAAHVMAWLSYLITEKLIESFMVEPPCTTFSIMRRPALRGFDAPYGYDDSDPQTLTGNCLALRGLQCVHLGRRNEVPGLFEAPFSSKVRYLPPWKKMVEHPEISQTRCDSCRFGSPHMKPFRFMGAHVDLEPVSKRCSCKADGRVHIQVQGKYTKESATYVPALADALSEVLSNAILAQRTARDEDEQRVEGMEDQLVNAVMKGSSWSLEAAWPVKKNFHINLLEVDAVCKLASRLASQGGSMKAVALVDSSVTKGATSKGRSSSKALSGYLRRLGATSIAGDIYLVTPYVPTRLNRADDPTRHTGIRPAESDAFYEAWGVEDLYKLAEIKRLRRWASNWITLLVRLCGPTPLHWNDRSLYRSPYPSRYRSTPLMDFDQTLGFPGEGPITKGLGFASHQSQFIFHGFCYLFLIPLWLAKGLTRRSYFLLIHALISRSCFLVEAMPITARNSADRQRGFRTGRLPLAEGRHVTAGTRTMRETLMASFLAWTVEEQIPWEEMIADSHNCLEDINMVLISYGRLLHKHGRPYQRYAETINAVSSLKLSLKRHLQGAWSLAFNWVQNEPSAHHVAMPFQVLMALLTTTMLWGWWNVGGVLALGWGAFLRAGEILNSQRKHLLLPSDVGNSIRFGMLSIFEPKTRTSAARHQAAKLDIPDLLQFVELSFAVYQPHQRLWPFSGQTLRLRLRCLLKAIGLPTVWINDAKPLDLGSLRAGGATWALTMTEDAELVRRRGRWISAKTMEIYIQELSASTFLTSLDVPTRNNILMLARLFPILLQQSQHFSNSCIAQNAWRFLFTTPEVEESKGQMGETGMI